MQPRKLFDHTATMLNQIKQFVLRATRLGVPRDELSILIDVLRNDRRWPGSIEPPIRLGGAQNTRYDAAVLIGEAYGPKAGRAVPALIEAMDDPDEYTRRAVVDALRRIGPEAKPAIPALIEALTDENELLRLEAASLLRELDVDPETPALVKNLSDMDLHDRSMVVEVLEEVGQSVNTDVPAIIAALADHDEERHAKAVEELGSAAFPALIEALAYRDCFIRQHAIDCLAEFGSPCVPHVLNCVQDKEFIVRVAAIKALGRAGGDSPGAISALVDALNHETCLFGVMALGEIGPRAKAAVPDLKELASKSQDDLVRAESARSLWKIEGSVDIPVQVLCNVFSGGNEEARLRAIHGLKEMGTESQGAMTTLIAALGDCNGDISELAARAIGRIGKAAAQAIPALTKALNADDDRTRLSAAAAIWRVDEQQTSEAVRVLIELLDAAGTHCEWYVDEGAMRILSGPKTGSHRAKAAEALGEIGSDARIAVTALREALRDEDKDLQDAAKLALSIIDPTSS